MAKVKDLEPHPCCYLRYYTHPRIEVVWPDDPVRSNTPKEALLARHISITLRDALKEQGLTHLAAEAETDLSHGTIQRLIRGTSWPTLSVIARLERKLGVPLWVPQHHIEHGEKRELRPVDHLDSGTWPTGTLDPTAPHDALFVQRMAEDLRDAMEKNHETVGTLSQDAGVSEAAIRNLLNGSLWPDTSLVMRLEVYFNEMLGWWRWRQ